MLGSLHIEMATLSFIGDWLQDSGWTTALSNSGVTTSGNESLLSGHNVAATKYVHQVTAYTLYQLMQQAFQKAKGDVALIVRRKFHLILDVQKWNFGIHSSNSGQ